jgi:HEAT repeat protein
MTTTTTTTTAATMTMASDTAAMTETRTRRAGLDATEGGRTMSVEATRISRQVKTRPARAMLGAALLLAGLSPLLGSAPARAGRGSSPQAVVTAIASGSADAIKAELERAEHLVCAACVDYVLPLVDSEDAQVRDVAAWWLVRRGVSRQVFRDMLTRLGQADSTRARNAADVLGSFQLPAAIPGLGAALSNPTFTPEARVAMAHALGAIRRPAAAAPLQAALADPVAAVRAAALAALRGVDGFRDGALAIPLLTDADESVRVQAVFTVADRGTAAAAPTLVALLQSDPSAGVRKRAAWALGQIHASSTVAASALGEAASSDASPLVRSLAHAALAGLARP